MIFKAESLALIFAGEKTQTRRPIGAVRYIAGMTFAIQPGRGKRAVARAEIVDVRQELLGEITPDDAKREGFNTVPQFSDAWRSIYGTLDPDQRVWVIDFRVIDDVSTG